MGLVASIRSSVALTRTNVNDDIVQQADVNVAHSLAYTDGFAAGQCDREFSDTRSLAASTNENLDLNGGTLTNALGAAINFARLKFIRVTCPTTNVGNMRVSRPASNGVPFFVAASDAIDIPPGGVFQWGDPGATGVVVTAATGDLINVANQDATTLNSYSIVLLGGST
jgi:hypothetical protein